MNRKVVGLDGRSYPWRLAGHLPDGDDERPRSSFHLAARALLKAVFPLEQILEEIALPGSGYLSADFFLPHWNLVVEVHGQQHYCFSKLFHRDRNDFLAGKVRDRVKREWCELNGITLVELPYNEDLDEWRKRIGSAVSGTSDGQAAAGSP